MSNIQEKIQEELKEARAVCSSDSASPQECAAAWDAVEELEAEAAHQKEDAPKKTSLETYCDNNPDAVECRVYDD